MNGMWLWLFLGGTLGLIVSYLLRTLTLWGSVWFYPLVWWSFILAVEGWNHRRGKSVLVSKSPGKALRVLGLSVLLWFTFEAYNLYLGNWYYVGVPKPRPLRWFGVVVSFATVLVGMWSVKRAILGAIPDRFDRGPGWTAGPYLRAALWGFGVVAAAGPFLFPDLLFPFVWGGLLVVVDLYEHQQGGPSFLRQLERGRYRELVAWGCAGAVCGGLWEYWNHLAGSGWIYTVPYMGSRRIFEMPIIGYLGFPPFALMTWRLYRALSRRLRRLTWIRGLGFWMAAGGFCLLVLWAMDVYTVGSTRIDLRGFVGWTAEEESRLGREGFTRPQPALRAYPNGSIARKIRFLTFARMGTEVGNCLWKVQVRSLPQLGRAHTEPLARWLTRCRGSRYRFWVRRVKDWKQRD